MVIIVDRTEDEDEDKENAPKVLEEGLLQWADGIFLKF